MLHCVQDCLEKYSEKHENMHSDYVSFKFEMTPQIYLEIGIGVLTENVFSIPDNMVKLEEYKKLPIHLVYHAGQPFSSWKPIRWMDLYEKTFQHDESPFAFIFDETVKPYEKIEKIGRLIKENEHYQHIIKQLAL